MFEKLKRERCPMCGRKPSIYMRSVSECFEREVPAYFVGNPENGTDGGSEETAVRRWNIKVSQYIKSDAYTKLMSRVCNTAIADLSYLIRKYRICDLCMRRKESGEKCRKCDPLWVGAVRRMK